MKRTLNATLLFSLSSMGVGCVPTVEEDPSLVVDGQILAVQFSPAEAKPKAKSTATALVVGSTEDEPADVEFNLCLARKALSELGPIAPECVAEDPSEDDVVHLGTGLSAALTVPEAACRLFGPQRPPSEGGQPPGRPADPDATGGYYQPVVARLDDVVIGGLRLDCGLSGGSQEQVAEYNRNRQDNANPEPTSLKLKVGGSSWRDVPAESTLSVPRDTTIVFRSQWSAPEKYQLLSQETRALEERREEYLASFYSTVGGFVDHRVIPNSKHIAEAEWQSPSNRGVVDFWVVVRDGRGGVGWHAFSLEVK
jgi:hypothetical protein